MLRPYKSPSGEVFSPTSLFIRLDTFIRLIILGINFQNIFQGLISCVNLGKFGREINLKSVVGKIKSCVMRGRESMCVYARQHVRTALLISYCTDEENHYVRWDFWLHGYWNLGVVSSALVPLSHLCQPERHASALQKELALARRGNSTACETMAGCKERKCTHFHTYTQAHRKCEDVRPRCGSSVIKPTKTKTVQRRAVKHQNRQSPWVRI